MAEIVRFSDYSPKSREPMQSKQPAEVVILPVVRVERHPEKPKRKLKQEA